MVQEGWGWGVRGWAARVRVVLVSAVLGSVAGREEREEREEGGAWCTADPWGE
jgi:hypothetical protein